MTDRAADEPVRLSWADRDEAARAEGRPHDGHSILPRGRAEGLAHWILGEFPDRFDLAIDPWPPATSAAAPPPTTEMPVPWIKLLGSLASLVEFASRHRTLAIALAAVAGELVLSTLAIHLPPGHVRTTSVVLLVLFSILIGYALPRPSGPAPETR